MFTPIGVGGASAWMQALLKTPWWQASANKNYYAVKLNAERANSILFRGKNYRLKGNANKLP